jgi:2-polyprenyl-6-hydroxyphenyl methylase/3-demethylubiquinone-9 3-methyltransferase
MYKAIENSIKSMTPKGLFFIAIYNKFERKYHGGTSKFWLKIKILYNNSSSLIKKMMEFTCMTYYITAMLLTLRNPISYIKNYKSNRGMSWRHDVVDWLGGYPYEFASVEEIINFMGSRGLGCTKVIFRDGTGCNEFLFINND